VKKVKLDGETQAELERRLEGFVPKFIIEGYSLDDPSDAASSGLTKLSATRLKRIVDSAIRGVIEDGVRAWVRSHSEDIKRHVISQLEGNNAQIFDVFAEDVSKAVPITVSGIDIMLNSDRGHSDPWEDL